MTRKDYVLIAACLEAAQKHNPWPSPSHAAGADLMKLQIAKNLADTLARDNPRFDRARFLAAAGVQT
jgi:hypothetical protein